MICFPISGQGGHHGRKNTEKQRAAEQQLAEIAKISDEELFKRLDTDEEGLNQVEAGDRLEEYGKNIIDTGNETSLAFRAGI